MPAWHVQKYVINVQIIVTENLKWRNAKACAGHVPMRAASAQMIAMLKTHRNALMPAVHVPKNAKSTTTKCAKNAQKNAENVKRNVERWRLKFLN